MQTTHRKKKKKNDKGQVVGHHNDSIGHYFNFGTRGDYKTVDGMMVTQYVSKTGGAKEAAQCESYIHKQLSVAHSSLDGLLGIQLSKASLEAINHVSDLMAELDPKQEGYIINKSSGLPMASLNVDASTKESHIEPDWGYTTIAVPPQEWNQKPLGHKLFHFSFNDNQSIKVDMSPGTVLFYHGGFLFHNQDHDDFTTTNVHDGHSICKQNRRY